MRIHPSLRLAAVTALAMFPLNGARAQLSSSTIVSAPLTVDSKTDIPGASLKPGLYTIRVIDNLKDRYILGIEDARGKAVATFIGLREAEFPGNGAQGAIQWQNAPGKDSALRGFAFSNGLSLEFVYPKATAVEIARINRSSVPAIDPESEGIAPDPKLSEEDRKVVTLWMLTSSRVGLGKGIPAIEAKRFQAQPNTELAENTLPPAPKPARAVAQSQAASASAVRPSPDPAARSKGHVVAAKLPQTASELPLILLLSGGLLIAGAGVRVRRRASDV